LCGKVANGYVYDEEAPIGSQLARDCVNKMWEGAIDQVNALSSPHHVLKELSNPLAHNPATLQLKIDAAAAGPLHQAAATASQHLDSVAHIVSSLSPHV